MHKYLAQIMENQITGIPPIILKWLDQFVLDLQNSWNWIDN
jgi:hypothetical protein